MKLPISPGRRAMLLYEVIVTTDMGVCHLTVDLQVVRSAAVILAGNGDHDIGRRLVFKAYRK